MNPPPSYVPSKPTHRGESTTYCHWASEPAVIAAASEYWLPSRTNGACGVRRRSGESRRGARRLSSREDVPPLGHRRSSSRSRSDSRSSSSRPAAIPRAMPAASSQYGSSWALNANSSAAARVIMASTGQALRVIGEQRHEHLRSDRRLVHPAWASRRTGNGTPATASEVPRRPPTRRRARRRSARARAGRGSRHWRVRT